MHANKNAEVVACTNKEMPKTAKKKHRGEVCVQKSHAFSLHTRHCVLLTNNSLMRSLEQAVFKDSDRSSLLSSLAP